jgi:hypothetical protein
MAFDSPINMWVVCFLNLLRLSLPTPLHLHTPVFTVGILGLFLNYLLTFKKTLVFAHLSFKIVLLFQPLRLDDVHLSC